MSKSKKKAPMVEDSKFDKNMKISGKDEGEVKGKKMKDKKMKDKKMKDKKKGKC